jgi:hypothetical protein
MRDPQAMKPTDAFAELGGSNSAKRTSPRYWPRSPILAGEPSPALMRYPAVLVTGAVHTPSAEPAPHHRKGGRVGEPEPSAR